MTTQAANQTQAQEAQEVHKTVVYPLVDVYENEREFLLVADLPGVRKDNLDISVEAGELRLRGETDELEYRRSFSLGDDVNVEAIDAKLEHGQLSLHLPKAEAARTRKIQVKLG